SGIFPFFPPVSSYKPWFFRRSVCLASPIWNGALVGRTKTDKMLLSPFQWEASFTFNTLSITGTSAQFAAAIAAALLLGPYCYCWLAGITGTSYLGYRVPFPFPYADFPNLCKEPSHYELYHLTLQILDLVLSLAVFCASLGFAVTSVRLLHFGHLNVSIGYGGEGGLPP
ncbi:TM212 protein, partial [Sagittarius serpentarius]|nr:TM212 protein [Sagittarius serpentarius]